MIRMNKYARDIHLANRIAACDNTTPTLNYIEVHSGSIPADADTFKLGDYSASVLVTFTNFRLYDTVVGEFEFDPAYQTDPAVATASGVGAWYAMGLNSWNRVMIGYASVSGGGGTLELDTINIVGGATITVVGFNVVIGW